MFRTEDAAIDNLLAWVDANAARGRTRVATATKRSRRRTS
jgi:hypothetical protein